MSKTSSSNEGEGKSKLLLIKMLKTGRTKRQKFHQGYRNCSRATEQEDRKMIYLPRPLYSNVHNILLDNIITISSKAGWKATIGT